MQSLLQAGLRRNLATGMTHTTRNNTWLIVYDLDGTLLNTLEDIAAAANAAVIETGLAQDAMPTTKVKRMVGDGARILMERMLVATVNEKPNAEVLDNAYKLFMKHYSSNLTHHSEPYPGVVEGLRQIRDQYDGNVLQLVCTNKPEPLARQLVESSSLAEFFSPPEKAVTGAVPGLKQKPDKEHILRAMDTFIGTRLFDVKRMVVVGDGKNDIRSATALGCRSIGVTYGFSDPKALQELNPTVLVDGFDEAISQIKHWIDDDADS